MIKWSSLYKAVRWLRKNHPIIYTHFAAVMILILFNVIFDAVTMIAGIHDIPPIIVEIKILIWCIGTLIALIYITQKPLAVYKYKGSVIKYSIRIGYIVILSISLVVAILGFIINRFNIV